MEKRIYVVGDRVDKLCAVCGVERGHVVVSTTKRGHVSRVDCARCNTRGSFRSNAKLEGARASAMNGAPYDRTRKYSKGEIMTHTLFGVGEVTAIFEPRKIDVLFSDRIRKLTHDNLQA